MMESTYSCSSFSGFVSSNRRLVLPPNSSANPKLKQMDLACPICRYPFGSGGKRVCTSPSYFLVSRSRSTVSRIKFEGRDSEGELPPASLPLPSEDEFAALMLYVFYM